MQERIKIGSVNPEGYRSLLAVKNYIQKSGISVIHLNLIEIRASQLNGCSFCIDVHTKAARATGEAENRIYLLQQWRELDLFSEEEKAILSLTEQITQIAMGVSAEVYSKALNLLGEEYLSKIMLAIISINAWNRIGVSTLLKPVY
ncbi:AhpD family alkylhydroperoxidase [Pedobacter sp. UYP30]|uniref:carboxymuconolactone decarboxylase family protein n=1 Tax=Pedobacter sp. UYP30 TaxID=1756400 RepID=UPI0033985FDE